MTGGSNLTVERVVSDVNTSNMGPLIKTDSGTLTLTGVDTYTGGEIIRGGTLSTSSLAVGGTSSGISVS